MLYNLSINDIAIIKKADITFENGFNVMTGETGAGKSIIIDAINAILGGRTSKEVIRTGAEKASVFASFFNVSDDIIKEIRSLDIDCENSSIDLQRIINADGRTICKINGSTVSGSQMKEIGRKLISIHGQLDNQALLSPEKHCDYIDKIAQNNSILVNYQSTFCKYNETYDKLKKLNFDEQEKARKIEMLSFQIDEIEKANLYSGESEELKQKREVIRNSERILNCLNSAYIALNGNDEIAGATTLVGEASDNISKAAEILKEVEIISEEMKNISYSLNDYCFELRRIMDSLDYNPSLLEKIEERLDLIYRLSKKYGSTEDDILEFLEQSKHELSQIISSDKLKLKLEDDFSVLSVQLEKDAAILTKSRIKASEEFSRKVIEELRFLEMPSVEFKVKIDKSEYDENGADNLEFLLSANRGEDLKTLSKIASGGELSRIMLAIKSVLADNDDIDTLIFDEIDTGVSGRAAQKIALKMKDVSNTRQVICVTHLAQIAAVADNHLLIEKEENEDKTFTKVTQLDFDGRVNELSRIMGGISITDDLKRIAAQMIKEQMH